MMNSMACLKKINNIADNIEIYRSRQTWHRWVSSCEIESGILKCKQREEGESQFSGQFAFKGETPSRDLIFITWGWRSTSGFSSFHISVETFTFYSHKILNKYKGNKYTFDMPLKSRYKTFYLLLPKLLTKFALLLLLWFVKNLRCDMKYLSVNRFSWWIGAARLNITMSIRPHNVNTRFIHQCKMTAPRTRHLEEF